MDKQNGFSYSLHITGKWGRNRLVKRDFLEMGTRDEKTAREEVPIMLAGLKPKGLRWELVAYPTEYRDDGIKTVAITQGVILDKGTIGVL